MRILVGYDGSVPADGALYDLPEAGLPSDAEATVITATAPWAPFGPGGDPAALGAVADRTEGAEGSDGSDGTVDEFAGIGSGEGGHGRRIRAYSRQALAEADEVAERGAQFLRKEFPAWRVRAESVLDDAAHGILQRAESWNADLVVLGTPDRSLLGRILKGSVTQKVLHHCRTGVRVSRPRLAGRFRSRLLLLAMDGSAGSEQALRALAARRWAPDTVVRVVAALEASRSRAGLQAEEGAVGLLPGKPARAVRRQAFAWIEKKVESACGVLASAGLRAVPAIVAGEPRRVLMEECREWEAHALFMGARGLNPAARFVLGSVSSALASHAPCTVEVHPQRRMAARTLTDLPSPKRKSRRQR